MPGLPEHLGLAHDGAADRHALALAAGQVLGLALQQVFDVQDLGCLHHAALDLRFRHLGQLQPEGHVVEQVHVRIERVTLEHHRDAPFSRRHVIDDAVADGQRAFGDVFQPRDRAQQRALAAARGPHEDHELAVADVQVDPLQDPDLAVGLADPGQLDFGQRVSPAFLLRIYRAGRRQTIMWDPGHCSEKSVKSTA